MTGEDEMERLTDVDPLLVGEMSQASDNLPLSLPQLAAGIQNLQAWNDRLYIRKRFIMINDGGVWISGF